MASIDNPRVFYFVFGTSKFFEPCSSETRVQHYEPALYDLEYDSLRGGASRDDDKDLNGDKSGDGATHSLADADSWSKSLIR